MLSIKLLVTVTALVCVSIHCSAAKLDDPAYPLVPTTYAYPIRVANTSSAVYGVRVKGVLVKPYTPKSTFLKNLILRLVSWKYGLNEEGKAGFMEKLKLVFASPALKEQIKKVWFVGGLMKKGLQKILEVAKDGSFFSGALRLSTLKNSTEASIKPYEFVNFTVTYTVNGQEKQIEAAAQVIYDDSKGWSIVSDIDDTIRWTGVLSHTTTFKTTFIEPYRQVPNMDRVFAHFKKSLSSNGRPAVFHYVSGSPVALLEPIQSFLQQYNFPRGSMHLQEYTLDSTLSIQRLRQVVAHKLEVLKRMIGDFPSRKLILIGDSGQADPRTYAQVYRWVVEKDVSKTLPCIYIREVTGVDSDMEKQLNTARRYLWDFRGVRADRWMVYKEASELLLVNPAKGSCYPPGMSNPYVPKGRETAITEPLRDSQGNFLAYNEVADTEIAEQWKLVQSLIQN